MDVGVSGIYCASYCCAKIIYKFTILDCYIFAEKKIYGSDFIWFEGIVGKENILRILEMETTSVFVAYVYLIICCNEVAYGKVFNVKKLENLFKIIIIRI